MSTKKTAIQFNLSHSSSSITTFHATVCVGGSNSINLLFRSAIMAIEMIFALRSRATHKLHTCVMCIHANKVEEQIRSADGNTYSIADGITEMFWIFRLIIYGKSISMTDTGVQHSLKCQIFPSDLA